MIYVEVVLPIALRPLTYHVEGGMEVCAGMAVMVGLGARKWCQGIVWRVHGEDPGFATRAVGRVLYERPLVDERQMRFWEWVSGYYMCSLGEVMAAAIPAMLKPQGMSEGEFARDEFRQATVKYVGLHPGVRGRVNAVFESFGRAKGQYKAFLEIVGQLEEDEQGWLLRSQVGAPATIVKALVEKELILVEERPVSVSSELSAMPLPLLTQAQQEAMERIRVESEAHATTLLHGVTGSGKTELFIQLAAEALERGESVLYLLPEIPLSWQLVERLRDVFGERLVAYHSKFTPRQRAELFLQLAQGEDRARIIVGTRMALFLPVRNLGLVIVDEEHDGSFKQESPAPRFHARDAAIMLGSLHGAKTLLGSATPSLESYYNASTGKYGLVRLDERYGGVPMPAVQISDTLRAIKRGERHAHFNQLLLDQLTDTLVDKSQAILFQNRRGFSPWVECGACGWVAHCPDCNVTLTFHKGSGELRCHYCGRVEPLPPRCPSCHQGELLPRGFGTEKIEEELSRLLPEARIARLDSDVAASPRVTKRIIADFADGRTDILVGTQMVTKSFDFAGVALVGVVNADNLLNYPDFRASERAFQMLTQAAGRAGRRAQQGRVVIQTSQPDHPILTQVAAGDYDTMARTQLAERRAFLYPPYCRLIAITLKHRDKTLVDQAAHALASALRPLFPKRLLGPEPPAVDRVQNLHIQLLLLKIDRHKSAAEAKQLLTSHLASLQATHKTLHISVDVDPI